MVTGARFVKKDRVIQLEIEEATSLPEGMWFNISFYRSINDANDLMREVKIFFDITEDLILKGE